MEHFAALLPELVDAIRAGFTEHFVMRPDGTLFSFSTGKTYEFYTATAKTLSLIHGTLYMIILEDGLAGTAIEYWEHFS